MLLSFALFFNGFSSHLTQNKTIVEFKTNDASDDYAFNNSKMKKPSPMEHKSERKSEQFSLDEKHSPWQLELIP